MKTSIGHVAAFVFGLGCLVSLGAQSPGQFTSSLDEPAATGKAARTPFEKKFPPNSTYAVVVRHDLPTLPVKGARESSYPIEIDDSGWKGPGSMFRAKATGTLAPGDVMKVDRVEFANDHVEFRLVSVEPHEIVVDASRPDKNRREQVATRITVPHDSDLAHLVQRLDAYVRLFPALDQATAYARAVNESQPDRRFTLGVVRRDGVLVPIANYDNGHWFRRWPVPAAERDVPIGLDALPADWWGLEGSTAAWTMWTPEGRARPLRVTGLLAFGAHCLMNVGLRTDYRSVLPPPPLDQHHYPKDGIAITGTAHVEAVTIVNADSSAWKTFEPLLAPQVDRLELPLIGHIPIPAVFNRSTTPVKLEVLCVAAGGKRDSMTAYFEAARHYPADDPTVPNPCAPVTFAQGWVHRAADGSGVLDRASRAQVTDCTMFDLPYGRPLGVLHVDGETVWVMERSRWGAEWYEITQVTDASVSVLLSVPGGSCRSIGD